MQPFSNENKKNNVCKCPLFGIHFDILNTTTLCTHLFNLSTVHDWQLLMTQENSEQWNHYNTNSIGAPSVIWNLHFLLVHLLIIKFPESEVHKTWHNEEISRNNLIQSRNSKTQHVTYHQSSRLNTSKHIVKYWDSTHHGKHELIMKFSDSAHNMTYHEVFRFST